MSSSPVELSSIDLNPMELDEEQVLWFRARRGHLAGHGAPDPTAAARAILGAQSQQLHPALLALSLRTKGRPTARALKAQLYDDSRTLVRTWGQRDTVHVYDPASEWSDIVAARELWAAPSRRGAMPPERAVDKAGVKLAQATSPLTRSDLISLAPKKLIQEAEEKMGPGEPARRLATGRLLWRLAHRGEACFADKIGAEQAYAARTAWFPDLPWPKRLDPQASAIALTRRYLAVHGPATANDVAHFFGARVGDAKAWLGALSGELVDVTCGERKGLVALASDRHELKRAAPKGAKEWPLRLLPMWESMLMGHADKSWTVPDGAERKLVWKKSAVVAPVAIARGRVVATWSHAVKRKRLAVQVEPLGAWRASKHAAGLKREAQAVADHMELAGADIEIG